MEQTQRTVFPFCLRRPPEVAAPDVELRDVLRANALDALRAGDSRTLLETVLAEDGLYPRPDARDTKCAEDSPRWHVVIPVRGRHDLVERCLAGLASLDDATDFSVTIGTSSGEIESLFKVADRVGICVTIAASAEPRGFATNCNRGFLAECRRDTDRVLFLNSDADPAPLGSIAGAFDSALRLADAAGPWGKNVSGFQSFASQPEDVPHALTLAGWPRSRRAHSPRLVGFALAVNAGVFRAVGGWDESFGIGNFDDDDLSLRIALASEKPHRLAFVPSAFVDHVGSASFAELPNAEATYNEAMETNGKLFARRWGWCLPAINEWWRSGR